MARTRNASVGLLAVLVVTAALAGGVAAASAGVAGGGAPAASAGTQECSFPFSSTDATGTEVTVEEEPESIVTLSPSAAQTMWEIGAQDKVVGVTKFATFLEGAAEKSNISGAGRTTVVVEKVVALEPDLVLAPNVIDDEMVEKLRESDLTVYRFEAAESLDDVVDKTRLTGQLVGECDGADRAADELEAELETVREAVEGEEPTRMLYVMGPTGYVAGEGTFVHTAIETAGGENIAAEEGITFYQQISPEVVAEQDPEWIVKPEGVPLPDSEAYNETTAIQEGNVLEVDSNYINQPAPEIVRPIRAMAKAFHPEAYAAANATATPTATPTETPTATASPTDDTPTPVQTTDPGFGVGVALVAVLVSLALRARR